MAFLERICRCRLQLRRTPLRRFCTFTLCLVLSLHLCHATGVVGGDDSDSNDINGFLDSVQSTHQSSAKSESGVQKQWGLADTTATSGKLFQYHIPSDAFVGNIHHYEVSEVSGAGLPRWLHFNNSTKMLEGVPTVSDVGQVYVTVIAMDENSNSASDVFLIDVLPATHKSTKVYLLKDADALAKQFICKPDEEIATISVTLDGDLNSMESSRRVQVIRRMAKHLDMPEELFKLLSLEYGEHSLNGNTMMAGPGNARRKYTSGMLLQWQVGCGHHLNNEYDSAVTSLEKISRDGTLAGIIGLPVVGWQLTAFKPENYLREKREAYFPNSTPTPNPVPTGRPTFTETVWESEDVGRRTGDDEGPVPESRIIPTMASPTFTHATQHHHHRHGHGQGTYTRGGHYLHRKPINYADPYLTASPTLNYVKGTPILSTPVPTSVLPIHPTVSFAAPHEASHPGEILPSIGPPVVVHSMSEPQSSPTYHTTLSSATETLPPYVTLPPTFTVTVPSRHNFLPVVMSRFPKIIFTAGKILRYRIPEDTFVDFEDGNTRQLKLLLLTPEGTSLNASSWIQFDSNKQEIYGIPLEQNIGTWNFVLEAMDSDGDSVKHQVEVVVRQHTLSRAVYHEFVMHLKYDKWRFASSIDWQIRLAEKLSHFFGDPNDQSILIRSIVVDPVLFTWTNDSVAVTNRCPHPKINELLNAMTSTQEGSPSKQLRKALTPEFRVSRVTLNWLGHCKTKILPTATPTGNIQPFVRNPIDHINATVGRMLHFSVPDDTFFDDEDGGTKKLKMTFLNIDGTPVPRSSWIQFNSVKPEFIGLPMAEDKGSRQYQLVAIDKEGVSVADALVVTVFSHPEPKPPSVKFSLHIDHDFTSFNNDLTKKIMVLDKLARLHGDPDPRYITVRSITRGSVVFTWSNNTLPSEPCPKEKISQLLSIMFDTDGKVCNSLLEIFQPEFNITGADVIPDGVCLADITPTKIIVGPSSTIETDHAYSTDDIYITTVIPAVVIAAMLLIAAVIACILYRKKRKGKMTMEDNSTFVNKGIPIIFADELEDKPNPAKSPVIMKEEKPPLLPPEYPRSSGSASPSTPPVGHQHEREHLDNFGLEQPENSPPYQPPPPFTSSRDSRLNRPKHTPTYRLPPPYVPP